MGICDSANNKGKHEQNENDKNDPRKAPTNATNLQTKKPTENDAKSLRYSRNQKKVIDKADDISIGNKNIVNLSTGLPLDHYVCDKLLGEGSYGSVYRVKHKDLKVFRAMKKITGSNTKDQSKLNEITNEIELLKSMDHPNIVKIFEFYNTKEGFFLITEFCSGGELFDKIVKIKRFEEGQAAYIMYQLLSAVFYCHNINIIHRDLKPENILIENEEKDNYLNIKVIDFGTAKLFDKNKAEDKVIGSAYYIAPEVLQGKYNEKCDIWSCGVIMYILLCGRPPFGGEDDEIIDKIKKGKFDLNSDPWTKISPEAKDIIKQMLDMNTLSRISAQKALTHKWFKKFKMRERVINIGYDKLKASIENLKNFKSENKLQQAALAFLVHNCIHLPEVKDLIKIFKNIDTNSDGKITKEELAIALSKMYNVPDPEEEVEEIFRNVDNDNNGFIEYEEYIRASIKKESLLTEDILKFAFKFFDKDGSGSITADEVAAVLFQGKDREISIKLTEDLIKEIDQDHNAQISFEEFKDMMKKLLN